ncbi:helitron_like_N domain-containing protein [Trichonephila clavipes]|nr:helitron_like_N domain-containing protein [Trichonephila clavipes]
MAKDRVTSDNYKVVIHPDRVPRGKYFLVEVYVKVESKRLRFIALNQTKLGVENNIHLQDSIRNYADLDPNNLGQMVILPSSFVNSAIYLPEYTQDAFTYVRNYGRPDLFITMICNPAWPEITRELIPGQNSTDRHDLTARVFKVKVQKLVALLTKEFAYLLIKKYLNFETLCRALILKAMTRRKGLSPDKISNLLRELSENDSNGG